MRSSSRICFLSLLLLVAASACKDGDATAGGDGGSPGPDAPPTSFDGGAGAACSHDGLCAQGLYCLQGHCGDVCAEVPGGQACNVGFVSSDGIPRCCAPGSRCCDDGFEHQGCYPADQPCPTVCPNSFAGHCAAGQVCAYSPSGGGLGNGACDWHTTAVACVDTCPAAQRCDGFGMDLCCGAGTVCQDHCCVVLPDAGVPDAGVPDAG